MDNQKAKFILQSFRPDGADAHDPAFAEALALATEDRELGEWLARERAQDAAFAAALTNVPIPEDLRVAIFEMLDGGEVEMTEFDAAFVGALAAVKPPEGLRDQILGAMEVEQKVIRPSSSWWSLKKFSSAAAAVVLLGVIGLFAFGGGNALAGSTPKEIRGAAISMLTSPTFRLDLKDEEQAELYTWLKGQDLPAPEVLPEGLRDLEGVGCRYLEIGEEKNRGSLICYRKNDDTVVHLVMMERSAMSSDDLPQLEEAGVGCQDCEKKGWTATQWVDEEHAFIMVSKMKPEEMAELF